MTKTCILIGAPVDTGQKRAGCMMGPSAYRVAGLSAALTDEGHVVADWGDVALPPLKPATCPNPAVHSLAETIGWIEALSAKARTAMAEGFRSSWVAIIRLRLALSQAWQPTPRPLAGHCSCCGLMRIPTIIHC